MHLVAETVRDFLGQGVAIRVVVVDNDSTPGELRRLQAALPHQVVVLPQDRNLGFGPAANVGFRWFLEQPDRECADWLAVAPHDARPLSGCVTNLLVELARRPGAGLACADVGDRLTPVIDRFFGAVPEPARVVEGWEPAGYPHGTLMLARRACLRDVGLFDERYFAYVEEADLALRARAAGWQVGVVRGAEVRNSSVGSHLPVIDYLKLRNTLLLTLEHYGRYALTIRTLMALWHLAAGAVSSGRREADPYWNALARVHALADFASGRFGAPPARLATGEP